MKAARGKSATLAAIRLISSLHFPLPVLAFFYSLNPWGQIQFLCLHLLPLYCLSSLKMKFQKKHRTQVNSSFQGEND